LLAWISRRTKISSSYQISDLKEFSILTLFQAWSWLRSNDYDYGMIFFDDYDYRLDVRGPLDIPISLVRKAKCEERSIFDSIHANIDQILCISLSNYEPPLFFSQVCYHYQITRSRAKMRTRRLCRTAEMFTGPKSNKSKKNNFCIVFIMGLTLDW